MPLRDLFLEKFDGVPGASNRPTREKTALPILEAFDCLNYAERTITEDIA